GQPLVTIAVLHMEYLLVRCDCPIFDRRCAHRCGGVAADKPPVFIGLPYLPLHSCRSHILPQGSPDPLGLNASIGSRVRVDQGPGHNFILAGLVGARHQTQPGWSPLSVMPYLQLLCSPLCLHGVMDTT